MSLTELFIIAVGLSMDAFAVSVCKGLSVQRLKLGHALACGVYFGGFQGLMPALGYLLGSQFQNVIVKVDHWIAFILLGIIGINMIRESRDTDAESLDSSFGFKAMLPLAVATSIDALAVGVSFAFLQTPIFQAVAVIGLTTFCFGVAGVKIGRLFGVKYETKAELMGGIILILIGSKILLEHLGILG